ncbi:hypothetical protein, partial [Aliivibrio sp. SR45-2]|uniref:hypothetical protein n=1 Tax=Aliivibrio sp. SR45-2 TaxID=2760931 RepID=UPI0015F80123
MNKNNLINLSTDTLETVIDQLIDNELVKSIPVVNTAVNVMAIGRSIRDVLLAKKLKVFFDALDEVSDEER